MVDAIGIPDLQKRAASVIGDAFLNRSRLASNLKKRGFVAAYAAAAVLFYAAIVALTIVALGNVTREILFSPDVHAVVRAAEARPLTWLFALYTFVWLGRKAFQLKSGSGR